MLESKEVASEAVVKILKKIMSTVKTKNDIILVSGIIEDYHAIPSELLFEYISLRKNPVDAPIPILFCMMEALDAYSESKGKCYNLVNTYFDTNEIESLMNYKYKQKKLKFPLKFDAVEITDSQWIGRITVQDLMLLNPIIKYNEKTQRNLVRKALSGDVEVYSIFLNRKALMEIMNSYQNGSYIPNTITLNIPEDVEFKFENGQLIFKSLDSLDILDGYHRYVAMTNLYSVDNNFDYAMEVRWVSFSEDKAKQFIWQEDQKTKMKKLDSETFNQNNPANQVLNMLDQVTLLKGIISRNGNVDAGVAAAFISQLWFNKPRHIYNRKEIVTVKKIIEGGLSNIIVDLPEIFEHKWSKREIGALFICLYYEDIESLPNYIERVNEEEVPIHSVITKRDITRLEEVYHRGN